MRPHYLAIPRLIRVNLGRRRGSRARKRGLRRGGAKRKRQEPRVRLLSYKKSAGYWFDDVQEPVVPGFNVPLRTIVLDFADEMSRRNTVRVNLKGNTPIAPSGSEPVMPQEKRQKTTHDFLTTRPPAPRPMEKEKPKASSVSGSGAALKAVDTARAIVTQEFSPSFAAVDGRLVTIEDSVKADPGLVVIVLQGLTLPKDMERIPKDL